MQNIRWGIIGCGDVTERKSGPAFNKVNHSSLVAVMRRDGSKARDYAARHHVPKWYDDAPSLINDPDVNAIYIATPPSSHEAYSIAAMNAGKPVYVEKPMSIDHPSSIRMANAAVSNKVKLSVAHYRRAQPLFKKIKQLIDQNVIGDPLFVHLQFNKMPLAANDLHDEKAAWRVNPAISGGGLFHDLAPHQLDLMLYFFGAVDRANGIATRKGLLYAADDMVAGQIVFQNGVLFNGAWCFNAPKGTENDLCEITGTLGKISFSVFNGHSVKVEINEQIEAIQFEPLEHVQQPMIEKVVGYFSGTGPNPCSAAEGVEVMRLIDLFSSRS